MGLRLKDKTGNELDYTGVTQFEAKIIDADGNEAEGRFTRLGSLNAYAVRPNGSENNIAKYEILSTVPKIGTDDSLMFGCSDEEYQALGGDGITVILTLKRLTVGNTYLATDMI